MVTVQYQVREDETNRGVDAFERTFADNVERSRWELEQAGHPFLHLHTLGVSTDQAAQQYELNYHYSTDSRKDSPRVAFVTASSLERAKASLVKALDGRSPSTYHVVLVAVHSAHHHASEFDATRA